MVAGEARRSAVARARRNPKLGVGLHLVLTRGRPILEPKQIRDLVDERGEFARDLFRAGVNFFFSNKARAQLAAEIRAQFEAFRRTGLQLDHLNGHNHIHLHPTVIGLALQIGRDYGLAAVRVPYEPPLTSFRAAGEGMWRRLLPALGLFPWAALVKRRVRAAGLSCNDYVFGMFDSGHMTVSRVRAVLSQLPAGISEIYFHPAAAPWDAGDEAAGYDGPGELAALTDAGVAELLRAQGLVPEAFSGLAAGQGRG